MLFTKNHINNLDIALSQELFVKTEASTAQATVLYSYVIKDANELALAVFEYDAIKDTHNAIYHDKLSETEQQALKAKFSDEYVKNDCIVLIAEYVRDHKDDALQYNKQYGQCLFYSDIDEI
jgi:hypothetical protein